MYRLRITAYLVNSTLPSRQIELTGLSKRMSTLGFQPIPGDQFSFFDLSTEDKQKIETHGVAPVTRLVVTARKFTFESAYSSVYISLSPDQGG